MLDWRSHLAHNPNVCHGQLTAKSTRIQVTVILDGIAEGTTCEQLLTAYPSLTEEHINAALGYAAELAREVIRLVGGIWITRIEDRITAADKGLSLELVGAGLGEDLDPAETNLIEFGREGILINAYLPDRFLRRKPAARKAIDKDLSSARSGGRTSQSLQVREQVVRIVGQSVDFRFATRCSACSRPSANASATIAMASTSFEGK